MSNFFAALDDSADEAEPQTKPAKKEPKKQVQVVEPSSKSDRRRAPNDRNTKGGRGGRTAPRDGKRAYDRRSGTGRGKEIKKGGGGAHNWGNDKNLARRNEGQVKEDTPGTPPEGEEKQQATAAPPKEEEEEDKTVSYEEFMAGKNKPESENFAEKEVREVENEFANLTPKEKSDEEAFLVMGGGKNRRAREKKHTKQTVDTGFRVASVNSGGGGGGDRRNRDRRDSGRGDRRDSRNRGAKGGKGGRRGDGKPSMNGSRGSKATPAVNVADTEAFPSL